MMNDDGADEHEYPGHDPVPKALHHGDDLVV
jgi:hypothetical protein